MQEILLANADTNAAIDAQEANSFAALRENASSAMRGDGEGRAAWLLSYLDCLLAADKFQLKTGPQAALVVSFLLMDRQAGACGFYPF